MTPQPEAASAPDDMPPLRARATTPEPPASLALPAPAANDRAAPHAPPGVIPPADPAPPVIIEIGAVEFRTIQPTAPAAPPPARPAPSLTLDAYLAQRGAR